MNVNAFLGEWTVWIGILILHHFRNWRRNKYDTLQVEFILFYYAFVEIESWKVVDSYLICNVLYLWLTKLWLYNVMLPFAATISFPLSSLPTLSTMTYVKLNFISNKITKICYLFRMFKVNLLNFKAGMDHSLNNNILQYLICIDLIITYYIIIFNHLYYKYISYYNCKTLILVYNS